MPGVAQRLKNLGHDRLFVERQPDVDREPPLPARIRGRELRDCIIEAERRELRQIGISR